MLPSKASHSKAKPKTLVLIDSSNFHFILKHFGLYESEIRWGDFFHWLAGTRHASELEVRWIKPEKLVQTSTHTAAGAAWLREARAKFRHVDNMYRRFEEQYQEIRIQRTGFVRADPEQQLYLEEKGVDVALGVELAWASRDESYDKIILISGDSDLVYAVHKAQQSGKAVKLIAFCDTHRQPVNMSRALARCANKVFKVYLSTLKSRFLLSPQHEGNTTAKKPLAVA
ncbi:MAG: NYN domain-containing protein [Bacteroidetes bacterium]|nr:MAG: NYN domain-containing protein [Bacteroidota bacterium]